MNFIDKLNKASWRGFEFPVVSDDEGFGRDIKRHNIINSSPAYEDTGLKENTFNVQAVIGGHDDFREEAEEFQAVLSQKGAGRLVLPHQGEMQAVVTEARRAHATNEIGIIRFNLVFERVDEKAGSENTQSTHDVIHASEGLNGAALNDFGGTYEDNMPDFVTGQVIAQTELFTTYLSSHLSRVHSVLNPPVFDASTSSIFGSQILNMFDSLVTYEEPIDYSIAFERQDVEETDFVQLTNALSSAASAKMFDGVDAGKRAANLKSVDIFSRIASVSAAAKASLSNEYESQKQALNMKETLFRVIGDLRKEAGENHWSDSYFALGDLMSSVNRDIDNKLGRLPVTTTIKTQDVRSAFDIAHRLFGGTPDQVIDMAKDLIKRNGVIHPGFIPPEELEVLIDA